MKINTTLGALLMLASLIACNSSADKQDDNSKTAKGKAVPALDTNTIASGTAYYQCTMDKQVISDKPGECPLCGMKLEKHIKQ